MQQLCTNGASIRVYNLEHGESWGRHLEWREMAGPCECVSCGGPIFNLPAERLAALKAESAAFDRKVRYVSE